ncbi:MAG: Hsp20/alpha crystallin family protein [Acidobacteriota bacterium]
MAWDPLRDLRIWQQRFEQLATHQSESWTPPIDVYETEDRYVIAAELPGLSREDIGLAVEDTRLTIRGRRTGRNATGEILRFHQVERSHGAFARTFEFSARIDADAVSADLNNGVLVVTLPKVPAPPIRNIEVR